MSSTSLAFHDITKVELKAVQTHPLFDTEMFKVQKIFLHMADGNKHEITVFLTNDGIGVEQV
jgi:hypothetical protein